MIKERRTRLSPAWLFWQIPTRSLRRGSGRDNPKTKDPNGLGRWGSVPLPVCKVLSRAGGAVGRITAQTPESKPPCHILAVCPWQITKPLCDLASFSLHRGDTSVCRFSCLGFLWQRSQTLMPWGTGKSLLTAPGVGSLTSRGPQGHAPSKDPPVGPFLPLPPPAPSGGHVPGASWSAMASPNLFPSS